MPDRDLSESLRMDGADWMDVVERARLEEENVRRRAGLAPSPVPLSKRRRPPRRLLPSGSQALRARAVGRVASGFGRGLLAGLAGTLALTALQQLTQRTSDAPARALHRTLGLTAETEAQRQRLALLAHLAYGSLLGGLRGFLDGAGMPGRAGAVAHFGIVEGLALAVLPTLGDTPPVTEWEPKDIAAHMALHAVYAGVTGSVYELLEA